MMERRALTTANMAVIERQNMANMEIVKKALTAEEMRIFKASSTKPLSAYDDAELTMACKDAFDFIAMDIGYNKPNQLEWGKTLMRIAMLLKRYYQSMTMNEIVMAFELLVVGKLDGYLPRDAQGNPDRKHYQQFNIEFLSKILNAYRKMRGLVLLKARNSMPKPEVQRSERELKAHRQVVVSDILNIYLKYKYTSCLNCGSSIAEMLTYRELERLGYVEEIEVTQSEQQSIMNATLANKMNMSKMAIYRHSAIKRAFDQMIEDEVQFDDYFEYGKE